MTVTITHTPSPKATIHADTAWAASTLLAAGFFPSDAHLLGLSDVRASELESAMSGTGVTAIPAASR